jgi:hypothetical protein
MNTFASHTLSHVYREHNQLADSLSKDGLQLLFGSWHITEMAGEEAYEFYHRPFLENFIQPT